MKLVPLNLKPAGHVSEQDLQMIVAERPTNWTQQEIETHLSSCESCQLRMLQTAADPQWRNELSSSLIEISSQPALPARTEIFSSAQKSAAESGNEFELETIRNWLGQLLQPPMHPEILGRLGRYDIESIIGCGGMGVVLKGFDRELHRPVAIKMILPRWARNGTAKQRFAREARAAAAVLHPNVIAIHGIDESNGVPWFVMPYVPGPSLQELVEQQGPLPETEIVRIGMQIASGLAAAHSQGLVHRDIKPGNILVDNQVNRVVITDFGLARCENDESMTKTGWLAGTLNYMSPEQSRGEDCGASSDLFSLGSLLYFLATGELPFRADSPMGVLNRISNEAAKPVRSRNEQISAMLANVIDRLLEKKPVDRFATATDLEQILHGCLAHLHQPNSVPAPRTAYRSSAANLLRWKWLGGTAVALILMTAAIIWVMPKVLSNVETISEPKPIRTWNDIAAEFELQEPAAFEGSIGRLGQQIGELKSMLDAEQMWPDSEGLQKQVDELERLFRAE